MGIVQPVLNKITLSAYDLTLKGNSASKKVICFIILIESLNKNQNFGEKSRPVIFSVLDIFTFEIKGLTGNFHEGNYLKIN